MGRSFLLILLFQVFQNYSYASSISCSGYYLAEKALGAYSFPTAKSYVQVASDFQLPNAIHMTFSFELPGLISEFERSFSTANYGADFCDFVFVILAGGFIDICDGL